MAKKGQQAQLQVELSTDEEWEKFLQRPGLLVIDIYSEWSGPCAGMQANLKKLKLELGGDSLQLAIAKCDTIDALERFRGTSEPTWMFVSGGKMVNFMYGANAPKLTKVITDELKIQQMVDEGTYNRSNVLDISERAPDEAERYEAAQAVIKAEEAIEKAKKDQECRERLLKESDAILENLGTLGVMLVFPQARDKYMDVLKEPMQEAGLVISISEKVTVVKSVMKDVLYFSDLNIDDIDFEETGRKPTLGVLFKRVSENLPNVIDDVVRQMVYGNSRFHPGDDDSPCRKLLKVDEKGKEKDLLGIWAPDNALTKATALKLLFPNVSKPFRIPEETPIPLHIAVAYDAFKVPEFQDLSSKYPGEVMRFGFFSSDVVNDAQLIAKTVEDFENRKEPPTYEEKIVLQLSKSNKECVEAFMELGPSYRSLDVEKGEQDCKFFFPADYDAPPQKLIEKSKKSKKKRTKMTQQITINEDGQEIIETSIDITTVNQEENNDTGEVEGEEKEDEEEDDEDAAPADFDGNDETVVGADKATSPIDNASKVGEQEKH